MKIKLIKIAPLLLIVFLLACSDSGTSPNPYKPVRSKTGLSYDESFKKWDQLKRKNGNSYTYSSSFTSWAGFGSTTEIEVVNGVAISRRWTSFTFSGTNKEVTGSYHENKATLNSHQEEAPPLTIDELYQTCAREYLTADTDKNTITFETSDTGLLWYCGYTPKMCADDCFSGINIETFEWKN
jgi:hypothetical protein